MSTDDWERPMGICPAELWTSFSETQYTGPAWFGSGRQDCVCVWIFRDFGT